MYQRKGIEKTQSSREPQNQAARREIVQQVKQGISAKIARERLAVPMHRTTVYRLLKRVWRL